MVSTMNTLIRSRTRRRLWGPLAASCAALIFAAMLPAGASAQTVRPETVASGLEHPWAVAFLPGGRFLVTERPGRMRIVDAQGRAGEPLQDVPRVAAGGQGGLLDVVLDSGFQDNRTLYFCFSEPGAGGNSTALARARLAADDARLEDVRVIFSGKPKVASSMHFGCRIVEARDGTLFLTTGERNSRKEDAQTLDNHHGKVIRVQKDGRAPRDNPFVSRSGALPEIWSYGHRNAQGAALTPEGVYWMHEHGPQGGDEINVPQAGRNYGWPVITFGENYGGGKIGEGISERQGMEQPLHQWTPSIAPSGMAFLTSDRYGAGWRGNLFVGALKFRYLSRLEVAGGKVVREHRLLPDIGRVRDVRQGPDGLLYILTDERNGKLVRVVP
jgi:glucose/arabinose dehydrogenase